MTLSQQQSQALERIRNFVTDKSQTIFILKGYAGTGKTTLIKNLIPDLSHLGKEVVLLAPTGRSAKVLSQKTTYPASTIHRAIYALDKMQVVRHNEHGELIQTSLLEKDSDLRSKGSDDLQFWFSIRQHDTNHNPTASIYIIDESSMIGSRPVHDETLHFGTDILLDDLLTFVQPHLGGKIIFVGDPAQLPPVGDNHSAALDETFFRERGLTVSSFELTEVFRQKSNSIILQNAMLIRNLLQTKHRNQFCFERKTGEVEDMTPEQVITSFCDQTPQPEIGNSVVLCYTNALTKDYNDAIRCRYFPGISQVVSGDILQVVRNHINHDRDIEFYNGDFVKVLSVSDQIETLSAPVWTDVSSTRQRQIVSLDFRDAELLLENGQQTQCKIIDTLLQSREPNLTPLQNVALYINFRIRHPELKPDDEAFSETLMQDPYFNAIRVKYGYAITGHKSQGGEWETIYVDYSGRTGLHGDSLRWVYTTTTRAKKRLYGVNIPNITPISAIQLNAPNRIAKPAKEAFAFANVRKVDLLPETASVFQKQKYMCIKEQLDTEGFQIISIQTLQYDDRYTIAVPSGNAVVDCFYNGTGLYTRYAFLTPLPENDRIREILENEEGLQFKVNYTPSSEALRHLFAKMVSACDDLNIRITNIVEHTPQYHVGYYLKTSGRFSQILFYFNSNQTITHALPSSDMGMDDNKLQNLIQALQK